MFNLNLEVFSCTPYDWLVFGKYEVPVFYIKTLLLKIIMNDNVLYSRNTLLYFVKEVTSINTSNYGFRY